MNKMPVKTFNDFEAALKWARTFARESTMPYQTWKIEDAPQGGLAVAVRSKNTGELQGWAE